MAAKLCRAVILGAPASGKGTISTKIIKTFPMVHISSGDKLRNLSSDTPIGQQVKKYLNSGQLVPDKLMIELINSEIKAVGNKSWLLDGFPRTVTQAENLWEHQKIDVVVNLVVPFDVIIDRVTKRYVHLPSGRVYNLGYNSPKVPFKDDVTGEDLVQRDDDKPEIVKNRLEQYSKMTQPVTEFYSKKGILYNFEGRKSDEIWPHVRKCLNNFMPEQEIAQQI